MLLTHAGALTGAPQFGESGVLQQQGLLLAWSMLGLFRDEWDALMLEHHTLRQKLHIRKCDLFTGR
jgi:hypothetical protein